MNPITGSLVFALAAEAVAGGHYLNRYIALGLFTAGVRALPRKMANVCRKFVTLRLGKLQYVIGVSAMRRRQMERSRQGSRPGLRARATA
jgi:hypothetical protein